MVIRVAIIEDEESQYQIINEYLSRFSRESGEMFEVSYFKGAVDFISDYCYGFDLVFMDIMMPDIDGMRAAEKLRQVDENVALIFITNMGQYAIQGYDVSALYFLLKPVEYSDFKIKMQRTVEHIARMQNNDFLILNLSGEKRKIFTKEIKYIEVFAHDVVFHTVGKEIHVRGTLSEYEKQLKENFCRINSCYIVNLNYVSCVKDRSIFIGDDELSISYARKKTILKALADYASKFGMNT